MSSERAAASLRALIWSALSSGRSVECLLGAACWGAAALQFLCAYPECTQKTARQNALGLGLGQTPKI